MSGSSLITHYSLLITLLTAGCGGSGALHLVPLNQDRIEKNEPLLSRVGPAPCWYSIDDETITIGLAYENLSLIGEYGKASEVVSIVVEGLPANKARDYRLNRTSVRGRLRHGAQHVRFASVSGILALWLEPDGRLKGRLRALAKEQQFNVMMGWTGDARVLMVGEFTATRDPGRTQAVRLRSEGEGMERQSVVSPPGAKPVTGPETTPAASTQPGS